MALVLFGKAGFFEGFNHQNRGQTSSRYIYICIYQYFYILPVLALAHHGFSELERGGECPPPTFYVQTCAGLGLSFQCSDVQKQEEGGHTCMLTVEASKFDG